MTTTTRRSTRRPRSVASRPRREPRPDRATGRPIVARGLVKRFGAVTALGGLDLEVAEGRVLGLLGPNGAGKTTAVHVLTTLVRPDEGTARVAAADVLARPDLVRRRIGLSGQYAAVDEQLTGFENLELVGRLSRLGAARARRRARDLLERFDLADAADRPVRGWSGGMRRRLDLAGALVADARVLFLDEPTTGLDPRSRAQLWATIRELVDEGATVLLTTQYMEEADQLADELVVIDHGRRIAHGTVAELKARIGGERLDVVLEAGADVERARAVLAPFGASEPYLLDGAITTPVTGGARTLTAALRALDAEALDVRDVELRRPSLDDVFLALTGQVVGDDAEVG